VGLGGGGAREGAAVLGGGWGGLVEGLCGGGVRKESGYGGRSGVSRVGRGVRRKQKGGEGWAPVGRNGRGVGRGKGRGASGIVVSEWG